MAKSLSNFNLAVVDMIGDIIASGVTVQVYTAGSVTAPTIYSDDQSATSITNPIVPDASGNVRFFAAATTVDVVVKSEQGITVVNGLGVGDHRVVVDINANNHGLVTTDIVQYKSASYSLLIGDCGKLTVNNTDAVVITLPLVTVGGVYHIMNGAADAAALLTVRPASGDIIHLAGEAGAANKDVINTKATAKKGDFISLCSGGVALTWFVMGQKGTWVRET